MSSTRLVKLVSSSVSAGKTFFGILIWDPFSGSSGLTLAAAEWVVFNGPGQEAVLLMRFLSRPGG